MKEYRVNWLRIWLHGSVAGYIIAAIFLGVPYLISLSTDVFSVGTTSPSSIALMILGVGTANIFLWLFIARAMIPHKIVIQDEEIHGRNISGKDVAIAFSDLKRVRRVGFFVPRSVLMESEEGQKIWFPGLIYDIDDLLIVIENSRWNE